jgi:predicted cupin superfamily sugar epimerase
MKYKNSVILFGAALLIAFFTISCKSCKKEKTLLTTQQVIKALKLQPMSDEACPGYFLSTYQSKTKAVSAKDRAAASLIYYLMTPEVSVDPWHIISSDEIMLYHEGAPMHMLLLFPDGKWKEVVLGPDVEKGQVMQYVIPANTWMGFAKSKDSEYEWGLYGVMVVPGWNIEDIRFVTPKDAEYKELKQKYSGAVTRGKELGLFL